MKTYELTYIITPEITSEEAEAKAKEVESGIQAKEGSILSQINPIAKTLAYPVAKKASGFVGVVEFQMEPEKLPELKETIAKDGNIVRSMVIIKEAQTAKKGRRIRTKPAKEENKKPDKSPEGHFDSPATISPKANSGGEKVELKDIEDKLDEILG